MFFLGSISNWFHDRSRNIFRYHDGTRWVRACPVTIGNRLEQYIPKYTELLDLLRQDPAETPVGQMRTDLLKSQDEARKALVKGARDVFELPTLGKVRDGVTDPEAIAVLVRYHLFMERLARDAELFAHSPAAA